jgi:hypothetical protein
MKSVSFGNSRGYMNTTLKNGECPVDFRFSRAKLRAMFMGKIQIKNKVSKIKTREE